MQMAVFTPLGMIALACTCLAIVADLLAACGWATFSIANPALCLSVGCSLAELFLDGNALFDLSKVRMALHDRLFQGLPACCQPVACQAASLCA